MSKQKSRARKPLEVSVMFEPNRLALIHLIDAYSQIVPLRRRATRSAHLSAHAPPSVDQTAKQGGAS